jgi:hypothetical protein
MKGCALSRALVALAPGGVITRFVERDWCSGTFAGKQVMLDLQWDASARDVQAFTVLLSEHELALPDQFVDDIVVVRQVNAADGTTVLSIEALLLDD